MAETLFAKLGGERKVRQIIDVFIDRVFADRMIGSFFRTANKSRIKEMEYQLTAEFLGGGVTYKGKPLDQAHAKRPIMNRDFMRRTQILRETLEALHVPKEVRDAWLEHTESLRPLITRDASSSSDPKFKNK
jgi:hemoglobin